MDGEATAQLITLRVVRASKGGPNEISADDMTKMLDGIEAKKMSIARSSVQLSTADFFPTMASKPEPPAASIGIQAAALYLAGVSQSGETTSPSLPFRDKTFFSALNVDAVLDNRAATTVYVLPIMRRS